MQSDIFALKQHSSAHAELCNAIYERELNTLVYSDDNADRLRRKLRSLPYYVKLAAWRLLEADTPLILDLQNASWQAPQQSKPIISKPTQRFAHWIEQHVAPGLPLPVMVAQDFEWHVKLDSVDRVDYGQQRFHLNRWGWCSFLGDSLEQQSIRVLKPSKQSMSAACAGHRWSDHGRLAPNVLSLRELLLSSLIHWQNFTRATLPKRG
ncbi:hypothetical protein [Aliidiomarina celeris]|uniref:hypothetical protein n=1 Tax=Aliidiomarina celeris TaxID=2249428 RepID=UPI000DE83D19|nr:hypothetical protein [Aliidiomarina celeris]